MMMTTKGRYAVMALVDMLANFEDMPVNLQKISDRQGIALNYLEQIFVKLRKAKIVKSVRGPGGGYIFVNEPKSITVSSIILAVEEPIKMTRCENASNVGCMGGGKKCLTHDLWEGLGKHIYEYLNSVTLIQILENQNTVKTTGNF